MNVLSSHLLVNNDYKDERQDTEGQQIRYNTKEDICFAEVYANIINFSFEFFAICSSFLE